MFIMHRLKELPNKLTTREELETLFLASLGLNKRYYSDSDILDDITVCLLDPGVASKLRDRAIEFYLTLTPEYIKEVFNLDDDLDLSEVKLGMITKLSSMPLEDWVVCQMATIELLYNLNGI